MLGGELIEGLLSEKLEQYMNNDVLIILSAYEAGASAVVSIFALAISFLTWKRDGLKITISAMVAEIIPRSTEQIYLAVTITNV